MTRETFLFAKTWQFNCLLLVCVLAASGCQKSGANGGKAADAFSIAARETEDRAEIPFIEASRPFLEAIAKRDYDQLFAMTSPLALKSVRSIQFGPGAGGKDNRNEAPLINVTKEQFVQRLREMEEVLGVPFKVINVYVQTIDADELAGKADAIDNMFNLGAISPEIPGNIRKASLRAQVGIRIPESQVKKVAEELAASEDDVRSGKVFQDMDFDSGDGPYLNFKMVLIEDGGLKMGYFEFMPPSIMD